MGAQTDRDIAALAARQHGNVTTAQLMAAGMNCRAISDRLKAGRLHRVHRCVYAVGRAPSVPLEHAAAAVLACGAHAYLSHGSALTLWALTRHWDAPLHVTVTRGDPRPRGLVVHRTSVHPDELTVHLDIRVTTPERTLLDCARGLSVRALARAVRDARLARLLRADALADTLARAPSHPGAKRLRHAVDGEPARSDWEAAFPAFCARYGLPAPILNATVCGIEVDALFPEAKVIVELDSWEFHRDRLAFETDRRRDAITAAEGYVTVRLTWERMHGHADEEAARLRATVAQRLSASSPTATGARRAPRRRE